MELSQFADEELKEAHLAQPYSEYNGFDTLIQPWVSNNKITNQTLTLKKSEPIRFIEKGYSERKKTIDERIEEMYRKYNKDDVGNNHINSRQVYRQMLKEFQRAQQFKQMGPKRQKSKEPTQQQSIILQIASQRINANTGDYKEVQVNTSPKKSKGQDKCTDKFQRMLKIREKVRKKNSVAVSKLKEKYLSQYNPSWQHTHRQQETQTNSIMDRQKARMKIRIRNQSKSKNTLEQPPSKDQFKIVGVYTNALQYAIKRNLNYSSNGGRISKLNSHQMNQTFHSFKH